MKSQLDTDHFELLDKVIREPASHTASEKNLLALFLQAVWSARHVLEFYNPGLT